MQAILEMGIENILWMQQFQTPLTYTFWKIFTNFGGTYYLWMVPALLWCVDYRVGLRVVLMLTLTLVLNAVLKEAFAAPRPFEVDSRILSPGEQGYGLPSGHAQLAVVFWGVLAGWVRHRWFSLFAAVMMLLMGLSRVVLGVHFPTDVLAGWALGLLSLWWYFRYQAGFVRWMESYSVGGQTGWIALAALVSFAGIQGATTGPNVLGAGTAGFMVGAGVGAAVALRKLSFAGGGSIAKRLGRLFVGIPVMLVLLGGLQSVDVPSGTLGLFVVGSELAVFGLWLALGAPWLFGKIRL